MVLYAGRRDSQALQYQLQPSEHLERHAFFSFYHCPYSKIEKRRGRTIICAFYGPRLPHLHLQEYSGKNLYEKVAHDLYSACMCGYGTQLYGNSLLQSLDRSLLLGKNGLSSPLHPVIVDHQRDKKCRADKSKERNQKSVLVVTMHSRGLFRDNRICTLEGKG
jgi:hypothetical protein